MTSKLALALMALVSGCREGAPPAPSDSNAPPVATAVAPAPSPSGSAAPNPSGANSAAASPGAASAPAATGAPAASSSSDASVAWALGSGGAVNPTSSTSASSGNAAPGTSKCAGNPPAPDYVCLQDCGPPVARPNEPPPAWHWVSPQAAAARKRFGCPVCLSGDTRIATPSGEVRVRDLTTSSIVWTLGANGERVAAPVVATTRVPVPPDHLLAHVTFEDGRDLYASPGHPTCGASRAVADLARGVRYDRATVRAAERIPYGGEATFDLLPAGPSGCYWANGVLLGSTLTR